MLVILIEQEKIRISAIIELINSFGNAPEIMQKTATS